MVTMKQLPKMIIITNILKDGVMSVAELSKRSEIKRSTLNYYLNLLEKEGLIERQRVLKKEPGRPTMIKFNHKKFEAKGKKMEEQFEKEELEMLNHPLTIKLLNYLKTNPNPSLKEVGENLGHPYMVTNHLSWLIRKGLIVNRYKITSLGKKALKHE